MIVKYFKINLLLIKSLGTQETPQNNYKNNGETESDCTSSYCDL